MMFYRSFVIALLLMIGMLAMAQSRSGRWVGDLYLVDSVMPTATLKYFVNEDNEIQSIIPSVATSSIDFPIERKYLTTSFFSFWYDDALYTTAFGESEANENGSLFRRHTFAKWQDNEWHFLGFFKTDDRTYLKAIPCKNNRFIVISNKDLRGQNNSNRTPFHLMSIRSGRNELGLDTSIDYGIDELRKIMSAPNSLVFDRIWLSDVAMTDEYAVVINNEMGLYWVFSLEKASLVKAGMIFKQVTPEMIAKKGGFENAIFCAHPEKNGTILLSAQEESFFISETLDSTHEIIKNTKNLTFDQVQRLQAQRSKELAERNPFVVWYRIYPENGKVEKLSLAPEGGIDVRDSEQPGGIWRPMPDGSVKMGGIDKTIMDNAQKKTEEKTKSDPKKSNPRPKDELSATHPPLDERRSE